MSILSSFEVEFIPVGEGERSGDAILARWTEGDVHRVMVYDGGTKASGQRLVDHIKSHYKTTRVDYVVNSHPDNDHASGLSVVLEQLSVGEVWMHRPWDHSQIIRDYFHDGRITDESLKVRLQEKMAAAYKIETLAVEKGIPIKEPFQGMNIGPFKILSPEKDWYLHELVADFAKSPKKKESLESMMESAASTMTKAFQSVIRLIAEAWDMEYLRENVETSAENESSVILFADFAGRGVMLTGDAGVQALKRANDYALSQGIYLPGVLNFIQVPHHGSRNNVSTSTLDSIIGLRQNEEELQYTKTAFVSSGAKSETHPRRMVVNAFNKRGVKVYKTNGNTIRHHYKMPTRNWGPIEALPISKEVEAWD
ncbi:hypothetical protein PshuTeo2_21000 [Pseudomonas hunanensis]|uniref:ComEC/Rec2 family competence protein n=1 Tax=Pseudomonas TaxID=286 RepID=UPI0018E3B3CC|nr:MULTISPECIES: MBL fold metallo-hydrolase [Pseudomonas]MDF3175466.1 MBL fold metallo-hydrolase [Pseudomonas sp. ER28]MDY7071999.1 hypothetical protein [Pseudomonas hunanensis]MEB5934966.1 MBL fold metallo-hydrolase [Pseudomonas mosselii]HDS0962072.1 MBL fold metallo-hydrolase [Pseudomonas putida]